MTGEVIIFQYPPPSLQRVRREQRNYKNFSNKLDKTAVLCSIRTS